MALHLFLTFLPSLNLEQGQAEHLVNQTSAMVLRTHSHLRSGGPEICTRDRQGLGSRGIFCKPLATAQLPMEFIICIQLLDGPSGVIHVELKTSDGTGPTVLDIILR